METNILLDINRKYKINIDITFLNIKFPNKELLYSFLNYFDYILASNQREHSYIKTNDIVIQFDIFEPHNSIEINLPDKDKENFDNIIDTLTMAFDDNKIEYDICIEPGGEWDDYIELCIYPKYDEKKDN